MEKKLFKYYAIRVGGTIIFRRTVGQIQKVRSVLYKRGTDFRLEQISYVGGTPVGSMSHKVWQEHGGARILLNGCVKVPRDKFRALDPFMSKGL